MAEFMDVSQLENSIKEIESDSPMKYEIDPGVLSDVGQNVKETEIIEYGVAGAFKEKFKLLRMANKLHEISRILLPHKFSLLDIKHDKRNDFLASMSKEYTKYFHEIQRTFEFQETTINLLQLKFKLLAKKNEIDHDIFLGRMIYDNMNYLIGIQKTFKERKRTKTTELEKLYKDMEKAVEDTEMEELSKDTTHVVEETELEKRSTDTEKTEETKPKVLSKDTRQTVGETKQEDRSTDAEEIVRETFDCFLKYFEAYKECAFFIADTFHKAAEKNSYLLRSIQNLFDSISILEGYVESYNAIPESSKGDPDSNESSTNKISEMTIEDLFNQIDLLITATEKAELAYNEIRILVFELITFE